MKIVIISQHIFPMQTPRAHRTTELMIELAKRGHDVTVYAVLGKYDYTSFQEETGIKLQSIPIRWQLVPYSSDLKVRRTLLDKVLGKLLNSRFEFPEIEFLTASYLSDQEFWVPLSEFIQTKKIKNLILYLRQNQWSRFGNTTVFNKLDYLLKFFDHQGPMSLGLKV